MYRRLVLAIHSDMQPPLGSRSGGLIKTRMLNILPFEEKKKLFREYRLRLSVVAIFAVSLLLLASLILLVPSYFLAMTKYSFVKDQVTKLEASQARTGQEKEVDTEIKKVNKKVALFLGDEKTPSAAPSEFILKVIGMKNSTLRVYGLLYDVTVLRERLVLTGQAASRDGLATFVETLKKDKTFTLVDLPISSYVKSTNIDFSVVVERSFKPMVKK